MLKFFLFFYLGTNIVQCFDPVLGEEPPPLFWEPGFQEFTEVEAIGKQNLNSFAQFPKLKIKSSELFLPRNVVPISYKLKIRPILEHSNPTEFLTAPGSVEILVRCETATDSITLHAHTKEYVTIFEDSLKVNTKAANLTTTISVTGTSVPKEEDDTSDFYHIHLSDSLTPGEEYTLRINFLTKISNTTLNGLYLSKYEDPDSKETKYLAVTQFESIAARRMFPSFDEPDLKSTFEIVISRAEKYNSMSNMPIKFTESDPEVPGYFLDHYQQSPQMSTYLVALIVSEFTCTTAPSNLYGKPVEACGPPHMVAEGGAIHAAQVSARILEFYERHWDIEYPLPKMTSVAIPDFEAGAMENFGLNTYRISALLYFPGKSSEARRKGIESTIAHELAHQNFGNLVTCKSWNQIFLNEGFATYVAKLGLEVVSPEFEEETHGWYTDYYKVALKADAKSNSHPIVQTEEYLGSFDAISYSKGASLIKMMENILSQKTLINGLQRYLKTFSFNNTQYQHLFETLDVQAKDDETHPELASFSDIMESWTIQPGFPLVRVGRTFEKLFHISQERFVQPPSVKDGRRGKEWKLPVFKNLSQDQENRNSSLWSVPIFIAQNENPLETGLHQRPELWLTKTEPIKAWNSNSSVDWLVVNPDAKAFLRVMYDSKLSNAVALQLSTKYEAFTPITRASLVDDGFECAWAGYHSITVALDRTVFLQHETDPRVWSVAIGHFQQIYAMLSENTEDVTSLKKYIAPRVNHALEDVGVEPSPDGKGISVFHHASLFGLGSKLKLSNVLSYSKHLVKLSSEGVEWNLNLIPVNIRVEILCAAVIEGDPATFKFLLEKYTATVDQITRNLLIESIGCSRNTEDIQRLLDNSINPDFIHSQSDSVNLLRKLVTNPFSRSLTFNHVRKHFKHLITYFQSPAPLSNNILRAFSLYFNTEERLNQMTELHKEFETDLKPVAESVKINIALIKENIGWVKAHGGAIKSWLEAQVEKEAGHL